MKTKILRNHLRTHRQRSGLSQRDLGLLVGCKHQAQISRYERSESAPPLPVALSYEVVFRVPTSDLFPGIHARAAQMVEAKLVALEDDLGQRSARDRGANDVARTLTWLRERKDQ
jgi:DNA-binding XRE family transcriptional regulator